MSLLLVDKEIAPLELLALGPVLMIPRGDDIQIEKLPEAADENE